MFYLDNIGLNELLGFRMSGKVKGIGRGRDLDFGCRNGKYTIHGIDHFYSCNIVMEQPLSNHISLRT